MSERCQECGMEVGRDEFHPYAACLMYMACGNAEIVRNNLGTVKSGTIRLDDLASVQRLAERRFGLLRDIDAVKGNGMKVSIDGRYRDELVPAARAPVLQELHERLRETEKLLAQFGVLVGTGAQP